MCGRFCTFRILFVRFCAYMIMYDDFFCYQHFFILFTHNITTSTQTTKTKQQTHIQYFKSPVKRKREREGKRKKQNKSFLYIIMYVKAKKHCEASINRGLAPLILTVVPSQVTICRGYGSTMISHTCVRKPVQYYCPLRSHKTSKQHSLLY